MLKHISLLFLVAASLAKLVIHLQYLHPMGLLKKIKLVLFNLFKFLKPYYDN